jgi:hypothetical protein
MGFVRFTEKHFVKALTNFASESHGIQMQNCLLIKLPNLDTGVGLDKIALYVI